jgi:IS30 family transposase
MGLSVEAKARIAELWAAGAPAWKIREEAGVSRHAVLRQVRRLRRPNKPEPVRSELRLSLVEREEISRGLAAGESLLSIGRRVGRVPSTMSREVNRNGGRVRYRACPADRAFVGRRSHV